MIDHRLERLRASNDSTWGTLRMATGRTFYTMERAWADNRPRESCIPPGRYQLVPWSSKKFPRARALVGEGVGLFPGPGIVRSAILVHAANRPLQLLGCIALGLELDPTRGLLLRSRVAVQLFLDELDATGGPHWLEIVERFQH